jgi:NTE family protein
MTKTKNVALVLSSGGARGVAHIGVIEELEARGYNITSISGTSIGAVIGGFYAAGKINEYREWICSIDRYNLFNLIDFSFNSRGVIKGEKVFNILREWMKGVTFNDLKIPFSCVAVDLAAHKEVVFESGNVLQAIRASIAIPGYIEPLILNGKALYDGGIINPIPINRVKRSGDDIVVAVDINARIPEFDPKKYWQIEEVESSRALNRISKMWHRATHRVEKMQIRHSNEKAPKRSERIKKELSPIGALTETFELMQEHISNDTLRKEKPEVHIEVPRNICDVFEFHHSKGLLEYGRQEARRVLDEYEGFTRQ